ncbi:hypothetical protein ACIQVK_25240 [Streptomyces sp. NPDC090493]|uniref:hypothetical protein n=1 Tax=Streptomyces sp. NPDC090493 TaxID=3365964 RepID=UPI0037F44D96
MAWYAGMKITADRLKYSSDFVVAHAALTSNSANVTSTTEVTVVTTPSASFEVGRAYRIEYNGLAQHGTTSLLDLLYLRFRRGSGALIRNVQDVPVANRGTASRNTAVNVSTIVTPSAAITDTVYMTASWDTGSTATFMLAGTSGTPGLLTVWDIGDASDYPGIATFS